jgi:hypothetical protein
MTDDPRLAALGKFTPEGSLTPGFGDHYLFMVGRDDVHGILLHLIKAETMTFKLAMFGYDDDELNAAILELLDNPNVRVQITLDKSQAGGVHERKILADNASKGAAWYNSVAVGQSATHQISHSKGGVLVGQGIGFEGSTNWSASGEGAGIKLDPKVKPEAGYKAQNNTLLVSTNPVFLARFAARLDTEHITALQQQMATAAAGTATASTSDAPAA